ncbi:MAG: zinc-ribbon domain-containing protein [Dehalococcoidia bacterium]
MQQIIRCPNCGTPNTPGQRFCGACGANLPAGCPNCGAENDPGAKFCGNCGAQLLGDAQPGGWEQQPPDMQQGGWGIPAGMQQQGGWSQQPPPPPPPPPQQQPVGWGSPPPPPPPQQPGGWGQPQQNAWAGTAPRSSSSSHGTFLVIILVVLLIGLGGFGYWAFYGSPPWQGSSSSSSLSITSGPLFVPAVSDETSDTIDMTITWETNELTIGSVEYGSSTSYGSVSSWESNYVKSHSIVLTGLDKDTSYHCRVVAKDKQGNEVTSNDVGFKTPQ